MATKSGKSGKRPTKKSTISGSSADRAGGAMAPEANVPESSFDTSDREHAGTAHSPGAGQITPAADEVVPRTRDVRGSGTDVNSDTERLRNPDNLQDKIEEDTFPASDPPSYSPITGVSDAPEDLKDNPVSQYEYGRRSQEKTHHFDRSSDRLRKGNPDVGDIDLGTIEADKPAQKDDLDPYDSADDTSEKSQTEY